jgi:hypothetical protein
MPLPFSIHISRIPAINWEKPDVRHTPRDITVEIQHETSVSHSYHKAGDSESKEAGWHRIDKTTHIM